MATTLGQMVQELVQTKQMSRHHIEDVLAEYAPYTDTLLKNPETAPAFVISHFFEALQLTSQEEARLSLLLTQQQRSDASSASLY